MDKDEDYEEGSSHSDDDDADDPDDGDEAEEEEAAEADELAGEHELQSLKEANIKALLDNSLETCCKPVLTKILTLKEGEQQLRRAFRSPQPGAPSCSQALKQRLLARKRFVPWGSNKPFAAPIIPAPGVPKDEPESAPKEEDLPEGIEPLTLWEPAEGEEGSPIVVDNMLTRFLRPHQREGVQFMFECVTGLRLKEGKGCILADDMGLGKTLQGITLLWTLLQSGAPALGGVPLAKRVIIVCPTSLVSNWDNECTKWLKGKVRTLPLCESSRDDVISSVTQFLHPFTPYQVLIISYETFRLHADRFKGASACDLLICDEAHRLKNDSTLTNRALDSLQCARRVLLSGTPMQNHLDEFYAMVDFCNPGVLGTPSEFRKHFEVPILAGREPCAMDEEVQLGEERSAELSSIVNQFIMRRTNALLSAHLPPKVVEVVCCQMTPLQKQLYCHFLESTAARRLLSGAKATGVLSAITSLKKLCNHPKLIFDAVNNKHDEGALSEGFEDVGRLFPPGLFDGGRSGRGMAVGWEETSGKMALLARMLHWLFTETDDRIVIVSNYTQTLDLVATLCRERCYPFLRLDGSTSINKRQKLVKIFNDPADKQFVFLLSSKAGGCGLNLIGANRLVLFDPDWNPANDKQAAARVWRDGQKKRVFVYRMLTTGTIEEKVFQRQMSKEGLQQVVSSKGGKAVANMMSAEELRDLFTISDGTISDTYDSIIRSTDSSGGADGSTGQCKTEDGSAGDRIFRPQVGSPSEDDLKNWAFHSSTATVPDAILQQSAGEDVTFVFTLQVEGKAIDETPSGRVHTGAMGNARTGAGMAGAKRASAGATQDPSTRASTPNTSSLQRHSAPAVLPHPTKKPTPQTTPRPTGRSSAPRPAPSSKPSGLSDLPSMPRQRHSMPSMTPRAGAAPGTNNGPQTASPPPSNGVHSATPRSGNSVHSSLSNGRPATLDGPHSRHSAAGRMQPSGPNCTPGKMQSPAHHAMPGRTQSPVHNLQSGMMPSPARLTGQSRMQSPAGRTQCRDSEGAGVQGLNSPSRDNSTVCGTTRTPPSHSGTKMNKSSILTDGQRGSNSAGSKHGKAGQEGVTGKDGVSPRSTSKENDPRQAAMTNRSGGLPVDGPVSGPAKSISGLAGPLSGMTSAVSGQQARSTGSRLRLSSSGADAAPAKKLRLTLGSKALSIVLDDDFQ